MKFAMGESKKLFAVKVTETRTKMVEVEAADQWSADTEAEKNWRGGEYLLDADCIEDVRFSSSPAMDKKTEDAK